MLVQLMVQGISDDTLSNSQKEMCFFMLGLFVLGSMVLMVNEHLQNSVILI